MSKLSLGRFLAILALVCGLAPAAWAADEAKDQATRQQVQPLNNAPVWREVRSEGAYSTQIKGVETGVLIQSGGETWRQVRNGPITFYGGILMLAVPLAILGFYLAKGPLKLHEKPTGRMVRRFSDWDRVVHWSTAISFVLLAVTGLALLFGKHVLIPVLGYTLFGLIAQLSKYIHNFVAPLFILSVLLMFFTFLKDNMWRAHDMMWFGKGGGLLTGEHVPSGRFNAGEKTWFWLGVFLLSIVAAGSGLVMLFPNFEQGRATMQLANMIHAPATLIYMALSLGHIYMGTIGVEGAYRSMKEGVVDETWAKEHHQYWYDDYKAGRLPSAVVKDPAPGGAQLQH